MSARKTNDSQGCVSAGHDATVDAAISVLRDGGNAVDAAIAGVFASMVAEPVLTGLFGGGIMTVQLADGQRHVLDFFSVVPGLGGLQSTDELDFGPVHIDFGPTRQQFHIGRGSAAVPGTLSGLLEAHHRWGSRPLATLVEPACRLGYDGVSLSAQMGFIFELLTPILTHSAEATSIFAPEGRLLRAGDVFRNVDLADVLEAIGDEGGQGATAQRLQEAILDRFGPPFGLLSERDLNAASPVLRTPQVIRYASTEVVLPPTQILGAGLLALGLRLLERAPESALRNEVGWARWMALVQRALTEARAEEPAQFLSERGLGAIELALAAEAAGGTPTGSTTHVSVVDAFGCAVGVTHSNGEGCGVVVPGSGVLMNNFLGEEDINPAGFHRQLAGQRMLTMMCPTLIDSDDGQMVLGTGGSNRIRTALLQVIHNLCAKGLEPLQAVKAPRWHVEGDTLNLELKGLPEAVHDALTANFESVVEFENANMFFGGVHVAGRLGAKFVGAGDARRGGAFKRA